MRKIRLSKQARKFLKKLPPKQAGQVARKALSLQENAHQQDTKMLKGTDVWRVDVGEYRICYCCDDTTVIVYIIGKRNDGEVYRLLQRKLRG